MIKLAFTLIGGRQWMGGYNYQLNLLRALTSFNKHKVLPYIFVGDDIEKEIYKELLSIEGIQVIKTPIFERKNILKRLFKSVFIGKDSKAESIFKKYEINIVFESATFYGWRFSLPVIAWVPDLQHRVLKHLFTTLQFLKREIGFQFQVHSNRKILVSSYDSKQAFETFYPKSKGKVFVSQFSIPAPVDKVDFDELTKKYKLPTQYFFLPGQFWQHKNHECVIKALSIAKDVYGESLYVVSTGNIADLRNPDHFDRLQALTKELGVAENFLVLGSIPYIELISLMNHSIALLNPSLFEGWSTTVEEAKTLMVDMVLSNISVHKEQAKKQATFFDPQKPEQLASILVDKQLHANIDNRNSSTEELIDLSQQRVRGYSDKFVETIEHCIKEYKS